MRRRLIHAVALFGLVVVWGFFLAVPGLSAAQSELAQRLNRTVVTERLARLGFSRHQAQSAVHQLDAERLAALTSRLGTEHMVSPFVSLFALLSLISIFALLVLTR